MNNYFKITLFFFIFCSNLVKGQDMHFTQFYASPLYLNPAFVGSNVCSRISLTYRNQWPGITTAYKSFLLSGDHYIQKYNLGVGFLFGNDVAGSGQLKTTIINPMISYGLKISRKVGIRFGFQPGIGIRSINFNDLYFGDQIARGGNVPSMETPTQNKVYFDVGAGALVFSEKLWLGTSFYHLTQPNTSLVNGETNMPLKYSLHGGAKIPLNNGENDPFQRRYISPAFNYRGQKKFDQLDVGFYYTQYIFNLGLWYRGIPLLKAYKPGYRNDDAVAIIIGVQANRLNIGYSYDLTISKLKGLTSGAQEVTLSYQLCKLKKKSKKYGLLIPCPKF